MALPAVLLLNACQKSEETFTDVQVKAEEAYDFPEIEGIEKPVLIEATEDIEFSIKDDGIPELPAGSMEGLSVETLLGHHPPFRCNRRVLLDSLNLNPTQATLMRRAIGAHFNCLSGIYKKVRLYNQKIIDKGNQARRKLLRAYQNGEITRIEFQRKLLALNKSIRSELLTNKDRRKIINALRDCHKDFLRHVNSILTPAQWRIWVAWHRAC